MSVVDHRVEAMKRVMGLGLLLSAFAPLVAVLTTIRIRELGRTGFVLLGFCAASVALLLLVLRAVRDIQSRRIETKTVKRADDRVLSFTSSYLVPVVVAAFGDPQLATLVATASMLVLMALIYVRAGLLHLNPTLALMGYRLYEVTAVNGVITMLLSRDQHIPQEGSVDCRYIGLDVAIQLKEPS